MKVYKIKRLLSLRVLESLFSCGSQYILCIERVYGLICFSLLHRTPKEGEVLEGNARFEGYSLDLIDAVAKHIGFKYRFELTPDGRYGGYNKDTKKWDGLIKQLLERVIY